MKDYEDFFKRTIGAVQEIEKPTKTQKDRMLVAIHGKCEDTEKSKLEQVKKLIITYPWRFAFLTSALQAIIFTLLYGTGYTNMFLRYFGG